MSIARTTGLALVLAVALFSGCRQPEAPPVQQTPAEPSSPAPKAESGNGEARESPETTETPSLVVETLDGQSYDLAARRGRWVVVNFWATWCAPCLKEMPELSALDAMREHIEVIGLAYEEIEPEAMRAFLQERPVVYPVAILDVYDPPADFATPRGLPLTYLITPDGKLAKQFLGPVTANEIEAAIEAAGGPKAGA